MSTPLSVRIETTPAGKGLLPWVAVARRGRYLTESQFFALIGYNEAELGALDPQSAEAARDGLEFALRLLTAFEYIPKDEPELEAFFERKLVAFEERMRAAVSGIPPPQAAVGIVLKDRALFATAGEIAALHVTDNSIVNLGELRTDSNFHFSTFHAGMLTARSCLLFLPKYLSALLKSDEIKTLPLSRGSEQKLAYLERILEARSVGAITFRGILLEAKTRPFKSEVSTASSINHLLQTESTTEELLSPPLLKPFLASVRRLVGKGIFGAKHIAQTYKTRSTPPRTSRYAEPAPRPTHTQAPRTLSSYLASIAAWGRNTLQNRRAAAYEKIRLAPTAITEGVRDRFAAGGATLIERFNYLPLKSKVLFIVALTFSFIFLEGILLTSRHRAIAAANNTLTQEKAAIQVLITEAEASLIYEDEEKARTQVEEARARIERLPAFKRDVTSGIPLRKLSALPTEKNIQELLASLGKVQERLRHVITVESPIAVLNLRESLPRVAGITFKEGSVFAFGDAMVVQSREGVIQTMTVEGVTTVEHVVPGNTRNTLLLISGAQVYSFNYLDRKLGAPITLHGAPDDAALYRRRLYTLHESENQIYKYEPTRNGFTAGTPWLSDGTSLSNAWSLAVDGSAYILTPDNTVIELRKGTKVEFTLKGVDPPFGQATKLWTAETSDYLYLLDAPQKRLVVAAKKDGTLKAQYVSPAFSDLRDFAIDESKKTAYLLDGTTVVSIPLSHLP